MSRYCYNCMQPIEKYSGVCPHCGQAPFGVNPVHQLKAGTLLKDRYLIGKSLGQGGFGITYIGLDTTLDVRVAVKEYYPNGISNRNHEASDHVTMTSTGADIYERGKLRFLQEAKTLARFYEEPGIVSVHDFFEDNNTAYIVMEYLDGITLKRFVEAQGKIPANALFRAMRPIMRSLEKVHAQDVIHRDISPDNIMLLRDGTLKLLDFGSAREVGRDKSLSVMLKPGYAPEEQYRSKGKQGPWTDVYSLCATMYFCLTGVRPEESVERAMNPDNMLKRPSELGADITQAQESVILRGMAVHARERYQSMQELADALKDSPDRAVAPDPPEPTPPTAPNDPPKPRRRRKKNSILPIAGILTVVLLISAGMKIFGVFELTPAISEPVSTPVAAESRSPTPPPTPAPTPQPLNAEELKYIEAENLLASGDKAHAAMAFYKLRDYKDARELSFYLWDEISFQNSIAAGSSHTVGLKADGSVVAVGRNSDGQCNVKNWIDIVAITAGDEHTLGLKADGSVVAVGNNQIGQCKVGDWTDIMAVAAGDYYTVGMRADGSVVAVGANRFGQLEVGDWKDIVAVAAGSSHTVGLKADGSVVAVGRNYSGQCDVGDWTDIVAVAAGDEHTVGLKTDGSVVAVGRNYSGQCDVGNWTDIVAVAAGDYYTVGLKTDGSVVAVGRNYSGQCDVGDWTDIVAVAAGDVHTVGVKADGSAVVAGYNGLFGECNVGDWRNLKLPRVQFPH